MEKSTTSSSHVISVSNTSKNAVIVQRQTESHVVDDDALAQLRARLTKEENDNMKALLSSASNDNDGALGSGSGANTMAGSGSAGSAPITSLSALSASNLDTLNVTIGLPSGLLNIPGPHGLMTVAVGQSPAHAAGMVGPGGIKAVFATIRPSEILILLNAVGDKDLPPLSLSGKKRKVNDEDVIDYVPVSEYKDIVQDILSECQKHGNVMRIIAPRPMTELERINGRVLPRQEGSIKTIGAVAMLQDQSGVDAEKEKQKNQNDVSEFFASATYNPDKDNDSAPVETIAPKDYDEPVDVKEGEEEEKETLGLGKIFIEFETVEGATSAQQELSGRFYNGHIIVTSYADRNAFYSGKLCDLTPYRS